MSDVVAQHLLEQLSLLTPAEPPRSRGGGSGNGREGLDLDQWLRDNGVPIVRVGPWGGGRRFVVNPCPWNPQHDDNSAYAIQFANGALAAGCHHNGCSGRDWHGLRDLLEPDWRSHVGGGESARDAVIVKLADVEAEEVEWLWEDRIPLGKVTLIDGDPEVGKSFLSLAMTAALTTGEELPGGPQPTRRRDALILTAEDGLADTVRPRAERMGADLARIMVLRAVRGAEGKEESFSLVKDLEAMDGVLRQGDYGLVILDPIDAYLGTSIDTHRNAAMRSVLGPLSALAERHGVAVVCIRHLTKGSQERAIYRGQGSIAYAAAARSILLVGKNPENEDERVVVSIKNNLGPKPKAVAFGITGGEFVWKGESHLSANELLGPDGSARPTKMEVAREFLRDLLAEGPRPEREVESAAADLEISTGTLRRAKKKEGITSRKDGPDGQWLWDLPGQPLDGERQPKGYPGEDERDRDEEGDQHGGLDHLGLNPARSLITLATEGAVLEGDQLPLLQSEDDQRETLAKAKVIKLENMNAFEESAERDEGGVEARGEVKRWTFHES